MTPRNAWFVTLCEFALVITKAESRSDTYDKQLKNIESKLSDDMFVFIKHLSRSLINLPDQVALCSPLEQMNTNRKTAREYCEMALAAADPL